MPVDPNIANLLAFIESAGYPPLAESTPADARRGFRALTVDARDPATLPEVASITNTTLGTIPARVYRTAVEDPVPTVVFFHGGGFVIGDLDTHEGACRLLCNDVGAVVVSVDYPLAPEHRFPAAVDDCYAALTWVIGHIGVFGADASRIAVGGDSAGGNLAAVCAQQAHADGVSLAAQLLAYPAVDMAGDYPSRTENADGYFLTLADTIWFAEQYLGMSETALEAADLVVDPRLSPLRATSLAGLAPAVVATAEYDPLRDEGDAYAAALEQAGVHVVHRQFAGLIHGFYGMEVYSPAAADAMAWINARFKELLG